MPGAYSFLGFRMCVRMYIFLYECVYVRTYVRVPTYIHDPVRLRLRHLYQVEFCSFKARYSTVGATVYCGHISSFLFHHRDGSIEYLQPMFSWGNKKNMLWITHLIWNYVSPFAEMSAKPFRCIHSLQSFWENEIPYVYTCNIP